MIIFARTIKRILFKRNIESKVLASVNIDNEVYLDVTGPDDCSEGILLSPQDAIALGEALIRAGKGQ
jgi:hypothetical protein